MIGSTSATGLGVHARSEISYRLVAAAGRFTALVEDADSSTSFDHRSWASAHLTVGP